MRLGWLVSAGVCAWLVACGGSSHKKVLICDASECGPDEAAGAAGATPDAGAQGGEAGETQTKGPGGEAGMGAELPPAEGGAAGEPAVGPTAELAIVLAGNGTVAVAGAAACLSSPCSYLSDPGTAFSLTAKPGADSRFVGWSGDCAGAKAITTVTVSSSAQCVATFVVQRAVAVAVSSNGGGSVVSDPNLSCGALGCHGQVDDGSNVTFTAKPTAGYRFTGWSGSAECQGVTQASLTIGVTQDLSCAATFAQQFTLAVSASGAAAAVSVVAGACNAATCAADADSSATFNAGTLAGFRFTGWSGSTACTGTAPALEVQHIASDITCIANYAARFTATGLIGNGTGAVVASSADVNAVCPGNNVCTLDAGTSATLVAPTVAGSRLTGWTGAGCLPANQSGNGILVTPTTGNVTCTAVYAAGVSVTGTVVGATGTVAATSTSPGAACTPGACGIDVNGSVTLTAPNLLPTYRFTGWSGTGCTGAALALTLSGVTTSTACNANYLQQFTIADATSAGGSVSASNGGVACAGNSCTVDVGTNVTLTATPNAANGYHFSNWTGAGCAPAGNATLAFSNVNVTCTAHFALNTFLIGASAGTNGTVTATPSDTGAPCVGNNCTVNFGVSVSLAAIPNATYHFAGWTGAGCTPVGSTPLSLQNINAQCVAAFAVNTFSATVTAAPATGGAVSVACTGGNCAAVPAGQSANFSAAANAGWAFGGWSANCGGGTASPLALNITANTNCVATFRPQVTATVSPTGTGTITASGTPNAVCTSGANASCTVDVSGSVTFVAKAAANAVFSGWSGACTGTNATATLSNVSAPQACTATFYQLWAQSTGGPGNDGLSNVVSLADGTVVGLGSSVAAGNTVLRLALVNLSASLGTLGRNDVITDSAGKGTFNALGLTTSQDKKSVTALAMHTTTDGAQLAYLHNESKNWDFNYTYSSTGPVNAGGGEVISTTDGGYAFCVGVVDSAGPVAVPPPIAGHLSKVDAAGAPVFDVRFCGKDTKGNCVGTTPFDVVQDPATKNYTVLSQVQTTPASILLTTIDDAGNPKSQTLYSDKTDTHATQFVLDVKGDAFIVTGTHTDAAGTTNPFFAKLAQGGATATWAYSLGDNMGEQLPAIARDGANYGLAGLDPIGKNIEAWFVLIDDNGNVNVQQTYGSTGGDRASSITSMPAGGFAIGGLTNSWSTGAVDMWTLRVDPKGALTFNGITPTATLAATAFPRVAITTLNGTVNDPLNVKTAITASKPVFTVATAGLKQIAEAP